MVHQDPYDSINPRMKVKDIVSEPLEIHNIGHGLEREKIVLDALREVKLEPSEEIANKYPHMLSGGQRQRVAMGRAIVRDPQLFLFDEPLSNLDASLRTHMRLKIKKLQRELGVTSVYVTHDQVEAMTLADRIVVLNQGQIEQVGTPSEVYHWPASHFVASFMGSPAMNFLTATLADGILTVAGNTIPLPEYEGINQEVTLGIRPEHADTRALDSMLNLTLNISVIEPLGPNQLVHGQVNGQAFIAVTPETEFDVDKPLNLCVENSHLHLFDTQGKRIEPTQTQ